jgi:hypothetical protein
MRLSFAVIGALALSAWAQEATVQGVVTDASNAVMPGVRITVSNEATGVVREATTNDRGLYSAAFLTPGNYRVEAAKEGFAPSVRPSLKLDVGQVARVDFALKVGAVAETIEVSAAASLINSETSVVGQVIDNRRIVELPLNGRNYLELARLTPGVAPSTGDRMDSKGTFSALGQRGTQTSVLLDGVDNSSRSSGGQLGFEAQAVQPAIDSVAEFKVVTNNNSAEYGFRMGGTVIVTTKSGTNDLHGSAYEFVRNDKLDAANFFAVGRPKPSLKRNQFGATAGGPLIKNRTFYFGSFEGTRLRQGRSRITTVPVQVRRDGDFGAVRPIFDPATTRNDAAGQAIRDPFPDSRIPAARVDPVSRQVIALYPAPNLGGAVNNHFFPAAFSDNITQIDFRGDHNFTQNQRFFARYSRRKFDTIDPGTLPLPADGATWQTIGLVGHNVGATLNSTLSPSLSNDLRFGFSRIEGLLDIPWTENFFERFNLRGIPNLGKDNDRGLTRFSPTGYSEVGPRNFWPNQNNIDVIHIANSVLKIQGRHLIKTGFEFRREDMYRRAVRFSRGQYVFDGAFTQNPLSRGNTGDGLADMLLGWASGATIGTANGETAVVLNFAAFVQDDWKITNRLTLNLGLRWDSIGQPSFRDTPVSRVEFDSPTQFRIVEPKSTGDCGCEVPRANFAPRIGFAYQASPKTVIRSGFGTFYGQADHLAHDGSASFFHQPPDWTEIGLPTDRLRQPAAFVATGFPAGLIPTTQLRANSVGRAAYRRMPTQYSLQWFFDIQRELPLDTVATLSYIGNGSRHLHIFANFNQPFTPGPGAIPARRPFPFFSVVTLPQALGDSSYQALTAKAEKRYSKGFTVLLAYTWSHAIDNVDETYNGLTAGIPNIYDISNNRGSSVYDRRHQTIVSAIYDLPFGKGRKWLAAGGPADWILGGWQLGGILSLRSGLPLTPGITADISNTGTTNRPNRVRNGTLSAGERTIDRWFDTTAFTLPALFTFGNSGRGILYGPPLRNMDLKIGKNFHFRERYRVEFRAEMFNFTNTPAFALPDRNVNLPQGGRISSAGEPRDIQLGLKLSF